nr:hypothetical protein [Cressdnaviricota sp.]
MHFPYVNQTYQSIHIVYIYVSNIYGNYVYNAFDNTFLTITTYYTNTKKKKRGPFFPFEE